MDNRPYGHCCNCQVQLSYIDDDPNGDDPNGERNPDCARCRAENNHDFDADPKAKFDRAGRLQ